MTPRGVLCLPDICILPQRKNNSDYFTHPIMCRNCLDVDLISLLESMAISSKTASLGML